MTSRVLKISGWIIMLVGLLIATVVLVYIGRGYSYDFHTGRLKLNGLVIFGSTPSGADISVNGKSIHRRTPYRSTLEAGDYTVDISKDGYRPWTKRVSIVASEVTWAQYVLLLPNQLERQNWFSAGGISLLTTSRDHRHFAYLDTSDGSVWTFDAGDHKPAKIYSPAPPGADQPVEQITAIDWSQDASRLLLATQSGGKAYHRVLAANGSGLVKLTEQYGFDLTGLRFSPSNSKQLFWLAAEGLRRLDIDNQSVSAVLADKVTSFNFGADNQILYVQATTLGQGLFSMDLNGQGKREIIQSLADSPSYKIGFASYKSNDVIAVLPAKSRTITVYTDVATDNPTAKVITKSADDLIFNPDGRFILYRDDQRLSTYDQELNRTYNFGNSKTPYQHLSWFDTYHLLVANGTALSLLEFDGGNASELTNSYVGNQITYTSNQHEVLVVQHQGTAMVMEATTIKH
jgi:hypothetical protein